ncbi:MAG: hypothetical protein ACD_23C01089G0001 [uncultured bacterium]|nr:MAG: hypothetical protein ACD_23C01089G0001 [uncultured bacterium]
MQFGGNGVEPFLQFVTLPGAVGGGQLLVRDLIGKVLDDGRTFMQGTAIIEHQERHITQRVDGVVVGAIRQRVCFGGGGNGFKGQTRLLEHNVGRQGAGAGRVIKFHEKLVESDIESM